MSCDGKAKSFCEFVASSGLSLLPKAGTATARNRDLAPAKVGYIFAGSYGLGVMVKGRSSYFYGNSPVMIVYFWTS